MKPIKTVCIVTPLPLEQYDKVEALRFSLTF